MIPRIIHQTAGGDLTWEERRMTRRLRRMLPGWTYRLWDDADNSRLMAEHFPDYAARYEQIRFGVAKADVARYAYMSVHGGFYFDTDYRLLQPIDDPVLREPCVIPLEDNLLGPDAMPPGYAALGNAVIGSTRGHPFWAALIAFIFDVKRAHEMTDRSEVISCTGPAAVTEFYIQNRARFADIVLPPKNAFQPGISLFSLRSSADARTYGIHLHWGSWRGRAPSVALRILLRRKLNALLS